MDDKNRSKRGKEDDESQVLNFILILTGDTIRSFSRLLNSLKLVFSNKYPLRIAFLLKLSKSKILPHFCINFTNRPPRTCSNFFAIFIL